MASGSIRILIAGVILVATATLPASALAQGALEGHFSGKTLMVIVPTGPGGDRMANATPFMRYFGRHLPGNPNVVPSFMPGAGGAVGMNYLQNVAARDGLTIATPLAPVVMAQVTGEKSVKYDVSKMNWIGRTADTTQVLYVRSDRNVKDFSDLKNQKIVIGSSGPSSASTIIPHVINHAFGTKMHVVLGYKGSAAFNLAVQRGETDGALTTWNNVRNNYGDQVRSGSIRILFQVAQSRNADLPKVPLAVDMATNDEDRALLEFMSSSSELGQTFIAPPDVPKHIVEALRRAFDATMKDPDYLAAMKKARNALNPIGGAALTVVVAKTLKTPKRVIDRYRTAVITRDAKSPK
jgi:tripartite-type tricarboxylate transporter receptor subunit TctC